MNLVFMNEEGNGFDFTIMPQPVTPSGKGQSGFRSFVLTPTMKWIIGGVTGVLILGGLGFLGYRLLFKDLEKPAVTPPEISLPPEEKSTQDSDKDGLTDEQEQGLKTNPKKADSDGDGLADGDEKNVYGSDPLLEDTDSDGFDDGREVARGYSPIVNSSEKAGAAEVTIWTEAIAKFGLHEPTPTTLRLRAAASDTQSKVQYTNLTYGYTVELPSLLTYREASDGREVGIYIRDTNPTDPDLLTDPISISLAVKIENQILLDWIKSQYQDTDYESSEEQEINGVKAQRLKGIKNEVCPQEKYFFPKDGTIIVLTGTCIENVAFADLYQQIVQSFKFN